MYYYPIYGIGEYVIRSNATGQAFEGLVECCFLAKTVFQVPSLLPAFNISLIDLHKSFDMRDNTWRDSYLYIVRLAIIYDGDKFLDCIDDPPQFKLCLESDLLRLQYHKPQK